MKGLLDKKLSLLLLLAYIYLGVFSLFSMSDHVHLSMDDCPYMLGHNGICTMDRFAHLSVWKALILTVPNTIYIFTLFILGFFTLEILLTSSPPLIRQMLYYKKIKFKSIISNLELQFSRGILNPKPF